MKTLLHSFAVALVLFTVAPNTLVRAIDSQDSIGSQAQVVKAMQDFTPLQGGVPIEVDGQIVGAIGVSGAASAQQDEEIAIAGASGLKSAIGKKSEAK
jgi:uncharacterized protein GlcG (DUF336 family)